MGRHKTNRKTQCSLFSSPEETCEVSIALFLWHWLWFFLLPSCGCRLFSPRHVGSHSNMLPFWFVILSVVYYYLYSLSMCSCWSVACLACCLQYTLELWLCSVCGVRSVSCLLSMKKLALFLLQLLINNSICHIIHGEFCLVYGMQLCSFRYKTVEIGSKGRRLGNSWMFLSSSDVILSLG